MRGTPTRRWARAGHGLAATALLLTLAACGGSGDDAPEQLDLGGDSPSATETPTSTPSPQGGAQGDVPEEPPEGFTRGLSPARGAGQEAVAEVWFEYWEEIVRMYRAPAEVDTDALYALATGEAASRPLDYAADMSSRGLRLQGGTIGSITSISVDGDTAVVEGCFRDLAQNVTAEGEPAELPAIFFTTRDDFRKEGPDWRMTRQGSVSTGTPCTYR